MTARTDTRPRIVFAGYQTARGSNGGMESATRIFEALADDFRWTLLTNRDTPRTGRWRARGADVVLRPLSETAARPVRALQTLNWARAIARACRHPATVLHSNDIRAAQAALWPARVSRTPFVHTVRDTKAPGERYGGRWHRLARRADRIVALSAEMSDYLGRALPDCAGRTTVIESIVDLETFAPGGDRDALRTDLGIAPGSVAVGIVAGVVPKKGQLAFLQQAMPRLAAARPDLHLHLIGDFDPASNSYARQCRDAATSSEVAGRVTFHGFTLRVADWLRALDIVVIPSRREGLARCMIEAMACATPVVSHDVCSAREMLEATGAGRVVGAGDTAAMTTTILELAADAQVRRCLGQAGRRTAEARFAAGPLAAKWRNLYASLVA